MAQRGVVNRVVPDAELDQRARELAMRAANGPTRAYAAHKALLRIWAEAGVAAARQRDVRHRLTALRNRGRPARHTVGGRSAQSGSVATADGFRRPLTSMTSYK
jgi:enoyl-CoA hydratase/carnithine racemase